MSRRGLSVMAAVMGVTLVAAACGSTSNVNNSGAAEVAFSNQRACAQKTAATPRYTDTIGTIPGGKNSLSGAGSTFAAPMYSEWTKTYSQQHGVQVAYQSVGSGAGIQQLQAGTIDFGDTDVPMTNAELTAAKGPVLHVPILLGAVVPAYNLPGVSSGLKFTGDLLGKIFSGTVSTWNDPAIKSLNPNVNLPSTPIAIVHRSDASGTTGIFTTYLTKTSPTWVSKLGGSSVSQGKTVAWPTGIGGKGNEGVAGAISQTPGALGYVELQYALAQHTTFGVVQNRSGNFVQACIPTVVAAAANVNFPPDLRGDLTDEAGADAYPITGTTYAIFYQNQTDQATAAALVNFFAWVLTTGQTYNHQLYYAPLGPSLQQQAYNQLKKVTVNGTAVVK